MKNIVATFIFIATTLPLLAQKGKNGSLTVSNTTIVNEFTSLVNDANTGDTQLTLTQTTLNNNNRFNSPLSPGDLILIIQMQGASVNASAEPWTGNGIYGLPLSPQWGEITNYNNCGNYELAEVATVNSATVITLRCSLKYDYTASGKVQIVRVPRFTTLTVNDTLSTEQWNGTTGGICAIEVDGDLNINANGVINATGLGFRGGTSGLYNNIWGSGDFASIDPTHGGMKGEGIAGYTTDYTPMGGQYGRGAPANGGGGSASHNAGGGGGANAGDIINWQNGVGVPNVNYNAAWGLETPTIANISASGGGRGGYTYSSNNQNANTTPPGDFAWGSDNRRNQGGLGGRPLDYSNNRLFFGGGGGSGELNDSENEGANGGNAGGLIYISTYGNINGAGKIEANGENGEDVFTNNPPTFSYAGNDGAGGAGAGGTIKIENITGSTIGGVTINANGGNGGNQQLQRGLFFFNLIDEAEGPGGGGGGGYVSIPTNTATINVNGGVNGVTNSDALTEFPPNGATSGANGLVANGSSVINLQANGDTICMGNSTTLTANILPTLPTNSTIIWYDNAYNMIGTGTNFSTGTITNDTLFHVGVCPGNLSVAVSVIIGASFSADTNNLQLTNEHCNSADGSITGINIIGGSLPLTYSWNGTPTNNLDTNSLSSGSYQLIVTDNDGCSSEIGTYTLINETGPSIDNSSLNTQHETCNNNNGALTGITTNGGSAPYLYTWNGNSSPLAISNLSADTYTLVVTDTYGCSDSSSYIINNIQGPSIDTSALLITPESCENSNGAISNISVQNGSGPFEYNWSNNDTTLAIDNLTTGNYTLIVNDVNNCIDSITFFVNELGFPNAGFTLNDSVFYTDEAFSIMNSASSDVVNWNYNAGNNTTHNSPNPTMVYAIPGTYQICQNVTNNSGCEASFCTIITIIEEQLPLVIPNVLTPNGDHQNDIFTIINLTEHTSLQIMDRWGTIVFQANPYQNDWDGKHTNGQSLSEGTYFYILENENETKTGYFSLIK
ncbi:MAG: gliding motility-associated C-terminal domain-containing protein [Flavobacteriales bacterium]|jgi:gliding motility-associated-like protein|nr:gliding motility-associated C-terminal domain-containing protein [Flavobacteriales bacterium]